MTKIAKGKRVTGADREKLAQELAAKYRAGASIGELSKETSRSYGFVHQLLSDAGVELRGRGGATRNRKGGKK